MVMKFPSKNDRVYWDESGARLQKLSNQSGWRRIGLKEGDVIVRLAGEDLHNQNDLQKALDKAQNTPSGSSVDLKVLRQNQVIVIDYKIKW
jgi:S1-C subfamily serine protease